MQHIDDGIAGADGVLAATAETVATAQEALQDTEYAASQSDSDVQALSGDVASLVEAAQNIDFSAVQADIAEATTDASDLTRGGSAAEKWLPRAYPGKSASGTGPLKAILPVDVFGQPAALGPIGAVASQYGLKVIEDSCEAIGALYQGKKAGRHGDFGIFAFYPNKQMTTGEGGLIITDDDDAANFMRALRNQGRAVGDTWLSHSAWSVLLRSG